MNTITRLGGKITYARDSQSHGLGLSPVRLLLFYCFCEPIVEVDLAFCDVTDSDLACLEKLPDLRVLVLYDNTRITGSGLRHIRGLDEIELLDLGRTGIDDSEVCYILSLNNLRELRLSGTAIGYRGVSLLSQLTNIERLNLCEASITDGALESVRELPQLAKLVVSGTRVTDEGLKELEGMQSLRKLHLSGCVFRGQPEWITCRVTPEGVAEFERKTPWCEVEY